MTGKNIVLHLTPKAQTCQALPSDLLNRQCQILVDNGVAWQEIPADLRGCAWLQRYAGDVANGGHSQFIANAVVTLGDAGAYLGLEWAAQGAGYIGAEGLQKLALLALDWVRDNPVEALEQSGAAGGRAAALDPLDRAYLKADRGDDAAFNEKLAAADPDLSARLAKHFGVNTPIIDLIPLHQVPMQFALLRHKPVKIVAPAEFEAAVAAQIRGSTAELAAFKSIRTELLAHLPGPWFCAAMLATIDTVPEGAMVQVWGGETSHAKARIPKGGISEMAFGVGQVRAITIRDGDVHVSAAPSPIDPSTVTGLPPKRAKGFLARWRQARQQAQLDERIAAENARRAEARADVASVAAGEAVHKAATELCLAESLAQFRIDNDLGNIVALRLMRADLTPAMRIEWKVALGFDRRFPEVHVIQTPDAVLLRADGDGTLTRYAVADLKTLSDQL